MSDIRRGSCGVVIEKQRLAVRCWSKDSGIRTEKLAAKSVELHVAPDIGAQGPHGVRQDRSAEAGIKLLGDRPTANQFTAFEHERLESALGQVKSGNQRVVTAANQNDALSQRHVSWPPSNETDQTLSFSK